MAQDWYAQIDGVTEGPFEMRQLRELLAEGRLKKDTPVRVGDEAWTRAGTVNGLFELSPSDAAVSIPEGGSSYAIPVAPSLNDTREWRMLADAAAPASEPSRPLPRRAAEAAAEPTPAQSTKAMAFVAAAGVALACLVALVVWLLSG